jgi:hypothetical protein
MGQFDPSTYCSIPYGHDSRTCAQSGLAVLWQRCPPEGLGRETRMACLFVLWWDPLLVAEHGLILLDAGRSRTSGEWIATPSETLTALSVMCYALMGLFVLGIVLSRMRREQEPTRAGTPTS